MKQNKRYFFIESTLIFSITFSMTAIQAEKCEQVLFKAY